MSHTRAVDQYGVLDTAPERQFDDIVVLAARICATPTALVSLLDDDRQWFKARVGFDGSQTGIDSSVCRHVVAAGDTVIIPDLRLDPRTRDNPLVAGEPHIRFYAGAPLATRFGIVGALCVIDLEPRPNGLTPEQKDDLERLARQVVALLEVRRDAAELRQTTAQRDEYEAAQKRTEQRWRDLYRNMDQAFLYARAIRNEDGQIHDWRYEEVNEAWGRMSGLPLEQTPGKTLRELLPKVAENWGVQLAHVVDSKQAIQFTRQVGQSDRWFDGTAQWVGGDDFTVIFHEVTGRVQEARRRDALLALGDALRDYRSADDMVRTASRIIGEAVRASRATFGEMDHSRERVRVAAGWSLPEMPPIEGDYRFDDYGQLRDLLVSGEILVVDDALTDPRTAHEGEAWRLLHARAIVNVPVRERGRVVAVLIVQKEERHDWDADEIAFLRNAADRLEAANARRREEEQQDVINGEITHRLKNALAMVQAIAMQTLRGDASPSGLESFTRRLQALGTAHEALTTGRWKAATLAHVLGGVLDGAGVRDRCTSDGPDVDMGARAALSASLLIHELATNAIKYGALSIAAGTVGVTWRIDGEDDASDLVLEWQEFDGPPVDPPSKTGFGSRIVRLGLVGTGGSDVRYERAGVRAFFRAPLAQVQQA